MTETISSKRAVVPYRVLARKYRPVDFSTLIGQDALVRTLSNAIVSGRLAQAYVLTGVRGVGKTTAARIIARCLNCIGPDGTGGPTVEPCGQCDHCRAISEDRHVDVIEQDAASRTGVSEMREILDGVRYRPTAARYKIYIIDEIHMLSTAAFNALLKTLEEPPEHVKFIFATTEIRKVPVTVLSRCQRFDLRRIVAEQLVDHFRRIAGAEGVTFEDEALTLIARAADGSVRDGLSLLDQAIAHGNGQVSATQVRDMLGLADREIVFDLFDALMRGDVSAALGFLADQYAAGADPVAIISDMLELTHWLTRLKVTPETAHNPAVGEANRVRGGKMVENLSVGVLSRVWQMLLKISLETRSASQPLKAVEMGLIRLAYTADLPTPAEALERFSPGGGPSSRSPVSPAASGGISPPGPVTVSHPNVSSTSPPSSSSPPSSQTPTLMIGNGGPYGLPQAAPDPAPSPRQPSPETFEQLVGLFKSKREIVLAVHLERDVHLVRYDPAGRLELRLTDTVPQDFLGRVSKCLNIWTGIRWGLSVSHAEGEPTLFEKTMTGVQAHPLVQATLAAFPNAVIGVVRDLEASPPFSLPDDADDGDTTGDD